MANYSIINLASTAGSEEVSKLGEVIIAGELEDKNVTYDIVKGESFFISKSKDFSNSIGIILIDKHTDESAYEFIIGKLEDSGCPTIYAVPYNNESHEPFDNFRRVGGDTTNLKVEEVIVELKTLEDNSFDPKTIDEERKYALVGNMIAIIRTVYGDGSPLESLFGRAKFIDEPTYQSGVSSVVRNIDEIDHLFNIINRKVCGREGLELEELEAVFVLTDVIKTLIKNSSITTQRDLSHAIQSRVLLDRR